MKTYIDNLLPRIKQYSQDLDRKEIFIDIPWITIDEDLNKSKYIFKRNGELVMSSNGQVKIGKWEYLSPAKSLLVDRIEDKILLNQYFADTAVMALKLDNTEKSFILANELIIPDFNVSDYLNKLYYRKNNIGTIKLKNDLLLEIVNLGYGITNNAVTINGQHVEDGILENSEDERKFEIKNSHISRALIDVIYKTDKGDLLIEEEINWGYTYGDKVFLNLGIAPDGKYRLSFMKRLYVRNGRIVKKIVYNAS
jgi:hypothetical protein